MCQRAFYITNGLQQVEQNVLTHPKVKNGRYFGTSIVRPAILNQLVGRGLIERGGYHPEYGTPRWHLTQCGMNASQLLQDLDENPLLRQAMLDAYEERRANCPLAQPDSPRQFPYQRNPRSEKLKQRRAAKERILAWVDTRLEEGRPISYRFFSRLIQEYSERVGITQQQAIDDFTECGVRELLMQPPYHTFLTAEGPISPEIRELLRNMWDRRDLRGNPDEHYRELERLWQSSQDPQAGHQLKAIKQRIDPIDPRILARYIHFTRTHIRVIGANYICQQCGEQDMFTGYPWTDSLQNADNPQHCSRGIECIRAIQLGWDIGGTPLVYGQFLAFGLTPEGEEAVIEAITDNPDSELALYWTFIYAPYYDEIRETAQKLGLY